MHRLVIGLVTLLGLAAATFVAGYLLLFAASVDRAAGLAPAGSAAYVNVYLQPSTGQQVNLSGLIGRLPGFADAASLDAKIDQVVDNLLSGTGITYTTQVKPWLGDQLAVAAWPVGDDPSASQAVVIAGVRDRPAAEASLAEISSGDNTFATVTYGGVDLHVADGTSYAFVAETLVIAQSADALRAVVDVEAGGESLADRADFREAMDRLPDDHLASVFVDLGAIAAAGGVEDDVDGLGTAAAALVAERDGLRLSGSVPFDAESAAESARDRFALGTEPTSLVEWMPDDTLAEVVVFGLAQTLEDAEAVIGATDEGDEAIGLLDSIRAIAAFGLGIDIDTDVLPLLSREVGLAVSGVDGDLPAGQLLLRPDDPAAAQASIESLVGRLEEAGAQSRLEEVGTIDVTIVSLPDTGEVAYAMADGIVIIGLTGADVAAAVTAHDEGRNLAATDGYQRTFAVAGTRAGTEAFVDIGALQVGDLAPELPSDARDILSGLGAFGVTVPSREDQIEFHAVLTVVDRSAD